MYLGATGARWHGAIDAVAERVEEAALRRLAVAGRCVRRRPRIVDLLLLLPVLRSRPSVSMSGQTFSERFVTAQARERDSRHAA